MKINLIETDRKPDGDIIKTFECEKLYELNTTDCSIVTLECKKSLSRYSVKKYKNGIFEYDEKYWEAMQQKGIDIIKSISKMNNELL